MSEEEIINKLQNMIGIGTEEKKHITYKEEQAIKCILDLYKKEKEQNSLIKDKLKELNIPMETLIGEFNRLEDLEDDREQLKWRLKEEKENYDKLTKHFIENHISKDKIREKIEKINEKIKTTEENMVKTMLGSPEEKYWTSMYYDLMAQKQTLKDLLEE